MLKRSPPKAMAQVATFAFSGIEAIPVEVQVQLSSGAPSFLIVGLADKAVAEARERVRAAFHAMGLSLPPRRIRRVIFCVALAFKIKRRWVARAQGRRLSKEKL